MSETTTTTETVVTPSAPTAPVVPIVVSAPPLTQVPSRTIDGAEKRRDLALYVMTGGGMAMTIYALLVLYLVRYSVSHSYWLGVFAMVNILILFTGIASLLVRRSINISKSGVIINDSGDQPS